jgi:hypothetical protein
VPDLSGASGQWRMQGVNAENLAVMVANPADLSHGRGDTGPDRKLSAKAVTDLWANPTAPLPGSDLSGGGSSSGGSSSGGSGGSSGGGGGGSGSGSGTTGSGS